MGWVNLLSDGNSDIHYLGPLSTFTRKEDFLVLSLTKKGRSQGFSLHSPQETRNLTQNGQSSRKRRELKGMWDLVDWRRRYAYISEFPIIFYPSESMAWGHKNLHSRDFQRFSCQQSLIFWTREGNFLLCEMRREPLLEKNPSDPNYPSQQIEFRWLSSPPLFSFHLDWLERADWGESRNTSKMESESMGLSRIPNFCLQKGDSIEGGLETSVSKGQKLEHFLCLWLCFLVTHKNKNGKSYCEGRKKRIFDVKSQKRLYFLAFSINSSVPKRLGTILCFGWEITNIWRVPH